MPKVYEVWKGSNIFFCGGRFIFGPDVKSLFMSIFLISSPTIVFCVLVAPKLSDLLSGGQAILPITICFLIWDLWFLLYTASRDPGIVPRNLTPPDMDDDSQSDHSMHVPRRPARTRDITVNGFPVKVKYCDTCLLYRPPRCSHCSICNNCVERFDHHCPWVGQCIGRRNYRYFFTFVSSTTLLCIYVFALSALHIKLVMDNKGHQRRTLWRALAHAPTSVFLMCYTFIAVWFVGGLTVLHLFLISKNQTTYENFRYRYDRRANPYDRGIMRNFFETLCTKIPPSKNSFRAEVRPSSSSGVAPLPSRGTSRNRSQASSGTRSPVLKEAQRLELAALVDSELQAFDLEKGNCNPIHRQTSNTAQHGNSFEMGGVCAGNAGEMAAHETVQEDQESSNNYPPQNNNYGSHISGNPGNSLPHSSYPNPNPNPHPGFHANPPINPPPFRHFNRSRWSGSDANWKPPNEENPRQNPSRGGGNGGPDKFSRHRDAFSM